MAGTQAEDRLTTLYTWSEEMTSAGDKVRDKHEKQYITMIDYVKTSNTKERILAAQLISRFFKYFPSFEEAAFESIVDLCESPDVDVRKHATIALIAICRDCKHLVSKAADILIQLYQTNQASEVNLINQSLTTLLNLDIQKFLQSFFTNFEDGSEVVRERALKFLTSKIHTLNENTLTKEVEEKLLTHSKKAMEDVTKDEFLTFINMLTKLKIAKTATGQAMIVLVIKSQAELNKEFDVNDKDSLDKLLLCTKQTIPLLSQYNRSTEYIQYICSKILPHLEQLKESGNDLNILQALAEMSPFVHADDLEKEIDLPKCQEIVFEKLLEYLPSASTAAISNETTDATSEPTSGDQDKEANNNNGNETTAGDATGEDFQFTHIEYLLYTFHQLGRLKPFFTELKPDIQSKLHYLFNGCTKYTQILGNQQQKAAKKEENVIRSVALRTTKNITLMVRDLFKKPPQFGSSILLSCKPLVVTRPVDTTTNIKHKQQHHNQDDRKKRLRYN